MSRAGRLLLAEGLVTQAQLEEAARKQSIDGGTIGLHLVRAGVLRETILTKLFCENLGLQEATPDELESINPEIGCLLTADVAVVSRVVPIETLGADWLSVAMADPTDDKTVAEVARITGRRLLIKVAQESELSLTLERLFGTSRPADLPTWSSGRDSHQIFREGASVDGASCSDGGTHPGEGHHATQRRYRAPVVLEGKYEKISPDELPPDAEAGYIPLTQIKRRPPGSSDTVIQVKAVDVGDTDEVIALDRVKKSTIRISSPEEEYQPPNQVEVNEPQPEDDTIDIEIEPPREPKPILARRISTAPPAPVSTPVPNRSFDVSEFIARKPEPYAGVPGGASWAYDENESTARESVFEIRNPLGSKARARRDTLMDLPKIESTLGADEGAMPIAEFVESVKKAQSRDEAIQAALSFFASYCRRSAFFILKRGVVEGFDALGPNLSLEQVRSIWIPLSSRSTLCEAVASKSIRIGPIGDSRTDAIFCAALGGRRGDSLIVPVTLGNRVVSVLYGDDLHSNSPTLNQLEVVSAALREALTRLLVRDKQKGLSS